MGRLHIDLPERFPFETELEVRVGDLNYGNHLGNDSVLTLVHEARRRYLRSLGVEEIGADGIGFVVADAAVVYRAQAFHGDRLRFQLATGELENTAGVGSAKRDLARALTVARQRGLDPESIR